jgi:NADH dehydrogenase
VIDRHNYHLFQPLLYQVATAALSPADIAEPIRVVLRRQRNATVLLDEVIGVDPSARVVKTRIGARQRYDWLILATGSRYTYFGHADWPSRAPGLKSFDDATLIRRRALLACEEAEAASEPALRQRLLTFVLVGAGATGVEMAGALAELAHATCRATSATLTRRPRASSWSRRVRAYWPGFLKNFPPSPFIHSSGWGWRYCSIRR